MVDRRGPHSRHRASRDAAPTRFPRRGEPARPAADDSTWRREDEPGGPDGRTDGRGWGDGGGRDRPSAYGEAGGRYGPTRSSAGYNQPARPAIGPSRPAADDSRGGARPTPRATPAASDATGPGVAGEATRPAPAAGEASRPAGAGEATFNKTFNKLLRSRRQLITGLGAGVVATGAIGSAAVVLGGGGLTAAVSDRSTSPRDAGSFSDRDASYVQSIGDSVNLGAAGVAETFSAAAAAALKAKPAIANPLSRDPIAHMLRRMTLGPTRAEADAARKMGLDAWIEAQLTPASVADPVAGRVLAAYPTVGLGIKELQTTVKQFDWQAMFELGQATLVRQIWSKRQLFEVMVDFWANHLNITNPFDGGWDNRSVYDNDVIRKHALGRYSDMLKASARSPAMLRYLDNADSHRRAVNENYGRELLELHTVGIDGGYTEKDVRHSAYIMTGRTVGQDGMFMYEPDRHWIDPVKVLGFKDRNASRSKGLQVGERYLQYLATHPATAKNIARKLAVRFVTDSPPPTLVERLATTYLENGTAIAPVLRVLFRSLEFWIATGLKTRRPLENLVATARALGVAPGADVRGAIEQVYWTTQRLGQAPLAWVPPNGYPDVAEAWNSAHAMLAIWNSHRALAQGWHKGLSYVKNEGLVGKRPATMGAYLDALAERLVLQRLGAAQKKALLKFLGTSGGSAVRSANLGGRIDHLVPLVLDSVYHALR